MKNSPLTELTLHGKLVTNSDTGTLVPKRLFYHFYVFAMVALLLVGAYRWLGGILALLHVTRRLCEQIWLFPYSRTSRMHVTAYIFGFFFYLGMSLSFAPSPMSPFLFGLGSILQFFSHRALFLHRAGMKNVSARRVPPESMLFKYMYCPHYFGEMLIYVSLSSWEKLESVLLAMFVVVSLSVNWRNHSLYYRAS